MTSVKSSHSLRRLNSVERKKRPLSVGAEVEQSPIKMRKSNSENKKPLRHQSSSDLVKRIKGANALALREIVDNSKRLVVNIKEVKEIKTLPMVASKQMLEVPNDVQMRENNMTKNVKISLSPLPSSFLSALPSNYGSSYKEENSSLILKDYRVSQALVKFYLLGRIFVPLGELSPNTSKKATIVVLTSLYRSPFISCLVVADKTSSVRLNMTGQAAKFWHDKLKVGQVLLLTKLGVIMEGAKVRLVQVANKDGVKVLGVAGEQELSSGQEMNLRMRERSRHSEVGTSPLDCDGIVSGSLANLAARKEVLADSGDDCESGCIEASPIEMSSSVEKKMRSNIVVDGKRNGEQTTSNLATKNDEVANSDDDAENIETKKERNKVSNLLNMAAKKAVLANSEDDESEDDDGNIEKNKSNILIKKIDCTNDDKKENDGMKSLSNMTPKTVVSVESEDDIELHDHNSLIKTTKNNAVNGRMSCQDTGVNIDQMQSFAVVAVNKEIIKDSYENKNKSRPTATINFDKNKEPIKRKSNVKGTGVKSTNLKTPEKNIEAACGVKILSPLPSASPLRRTDSSWNRDIKMMFEEQSLGKKEDAKALIKRIGDGKRDGKGQSIVKVSAKRKVLQDELDSNNEDEENEMQGSDVDQMQGSDVDQSKSHKIISETELTDNEEGMESELNISSEDEGMESGLSNDEFLDKSKVKSNTIEKKSKTPQSKCQNIVKNILRNISLKNIMTRNICADIVDKMVDDVIGNLASTVVKCNGSLTTSSSKVDKEVDRLCNLGNLVEKRRVPGAEDHKAKKSGKERKKDASKANESEASSGGSSLDESDHETDQWFQQQKSLKNLDSSSDYSDCNKPDTDSSESSEINDVNKSDSSSAREIEENGHVVRSRVKTTASDSSTDFNSSSSKRKKKTKRTPHLLTFDLSESDEEEKIETTKRLSSKSSFRLKKKKQSNILKRCSSSSDMDSSEEDYSNSRARKDSKRSAENMNKSYGKSLNTESSFNIESSDTDSDEGGNSHESSRPAQLDNYLAHVDVSFDELDNIPQSDSDNELDNIPQSDSDQECLLTGMSSGTEEVSSGTEKGPLKQNLRTDKEMKKTATDVNQQTAVLSTSTVKSLGLLQQAPRSENKQEMKTEMNIIQKTGMALMDAVGTFFQPKPNLENQPEEKGALVPLKQNPQNMKRPEENAAMTPLKQNPQNMKPPRKVALDELWFGRHQAVVAKNKNSKIKLEDGQKETEATGSKPTDGEQMEEDIGDDEEEHGVKETYIDYLPVYLDYGLPHPDIVVESSSLASVLPPAITRPLHLPQEVIDQGKLSRVQLESVTYASQMHEVIMPNNNRAGYLIGDGAGVGKGRTIAGIIT